MCRKLIYLTSFVLVLALVSTNVVFGGIVIVRPVAIGYDDAEEAVVDGDMDLGSSDLELVYDNTPGDPVDLQVIGLRFRDIWIPKGSTILSAHVQFSEEDTNDDWHIGATHILIEGELNPNPGGFTSSDHDITQRSRTTAIVPWSPARWMSNHQEGPDARTSDISSIIQEIVNQQGWAAGNALVLLFSQDPANPSAGIREAESFDGAEGYIDQMPTLTIEFTAKSAMQPSPADGVLHEYTWASLSWEPGSTAATHDVYFGENFADVEAGTGGTFQSNQRGAVFVVGLPGFAYPDGLASDTTYYWRIDEVEADGVTIHTGDVWSFTTPPLTAWNPNPPDGVKSADPHANLSWAAGLGAIMHEVYFGDNFADVEAGTPNTYKGPVGRTTYTLGPLAKGKNYFWRVDEFDGVATYKGDVWCFKTLPHEIPITDPNLIGWWKLDEGSGTTAIDWSGHGNDGTLETASWFFPTPARVAGVWGDALDFTVGDNYVELPAGIVGSDAGTVCMWIKTTQSAEGMLFYATETDGDGFGSDNELHINTRNDGRLELCFEGSPDVRVRIPAVNDDIWHHIAATWDINGDMKLYPDGGTPESQPHNRNNVSFIGYIRLGSPEDPRRFYSGLLDDVWLYNRVLNQQEIQEAMTGGPLLAREPNPADGSTPDIEHVTSLSWSPGKNAAEHYVYFGTNEFAVSSADTSDTSGIYRGRQAATSYTPPEGVEWGQTYYWRIDEHNNDGSVSEGRVWSFTVADYLVVDDIEDYNDFEPDRIFDTWIDGWGVPENGSQVGYAEPTFVETTIVHGGKQSMPFSYDNTAGVAYSEAERTFVPAQDWTRKGVMSLTLWFRGLPASVGSFTPGPPVYTITAGGEDIWDEADEFHYAYKQLSGLGSIQAKVLSVTNTDPWAKAGVMIRETLAPGSTFAAVYITPGNGCRFHLRSIIDGSATSDSSVVTNEQKAITAPYWVKLERVGGNRFNAYYSSNPATDPWHLMAWSPQIVTMAPDVYIGLALTSHNVNTTCVAEFSDVTTTGTVTGQWQSQDIGIESNVADQLYVALADSANNSATVKHPDPDAVLLDTWQEWNIDLTDFGGVNPASIKKMSIGVGDRVTPQAGGSGKLYIDDIRLYRPQPAQ